MKKFGEQDPSRMLREQNFNKILSAFEHITDMADRELDPEIFETVTALNALGYRTMGSCAGHLDESRPRFPYIVIYPEEPRERFIGEIEKKREIAAIREKSVSEIDWDDSEEGREFWDWVDDADGKETAEYRVWTEMCDQIREEIQSVIEAFTANSSHAHGLLRIAKGSGAIHIETADFERIHEATNEELAREIPLAQQEMFAFGAWLKQHYLDGDKL